MGPLALIIPVVVLFVMLAPVVAVLSLCELVGKLWQIRFPSAFPKQPVPDPPGTAEFWQQWNAAHPEPEPNPCRLERWLQRRVERTKP